MLRPLPQRLLLHTPTLVLECDEQRYCLYAYWGSAQTLDSLQAGYEHILTVLEQHQVRSLLDDHRLVRGTWTETAIWVAQQWLPRAQQAGLQQQYVVYSFDFFARCSSEALVKQAPSGIIRGVENIEAARQALRLP